MTMVYDTKNMTETKSILAKSLQHTQGQVYIDLEHKSHAMLSS